MTVKVADCDTTKSVYTPSEVESALSTQCIHVDNEQDEIKMSDYNMKLKNSDVLDNMDDFVTHLPPDHQKQIKTLIQNHGKLFPDTPSLTLMLPHMTLMWVIHSPLSSTHTG